jgi:opacity protein-like surface antigen
MKKQISATALAGLGMLFSGIALADGMPQASLKDAPSAAPIWSGIYIGAGVGYGHLIAENNYWDPGFSSSWKGEGAAGGLGTIVLGIDRQLRERYVAGLFGEFDWSSIEITYAATAIPEQTFRIRGAASAGARAGYVITSSTLLYLTAGYTRTSGKSDRYFDIASGGVNYPGKSTVNLNGPFVGIGTETQVGNGLALRGEIRYTMFNDEVTNSQPSVPFTDSFHANLLTGRLVLIYKFHHEEQHADAFK